MKRATLIMIAFAVALVPYPLNVAFARPVVAIVEAVQQGDPTPGPCGQGYADQCPSGNPSECECLRFSGATRGTLSGKGGATISLTLDHGLSTGTEVECLAFFADITLVSLEGAELSATGAVCNTSDGGPQLVSGGYAVANQASGRTGTGTLNGILDTHDRIKLKMRGNLVR